MAADPAVRARRDWTLGTFGLAAGARLIAGPLPLNYYDVSYALVWGREILDGRLPDYRTPGASTPHPLGTLLATMAAAFGSPGAWYVVQAIVFLSLGLAGTALFVLARACLARVAEAAPSTVTAGALLAAGALVLSPPFLTGALGGSGLSDMPALALVLAAAAVVAEHPDRTRGPLVLLGLAGLMRPEAWGLAVAYWLYLACARTPVPRLIAAAGLVVAAPLIWAVCDTIVTGSPTYSLTKTQDASIAGGFTHGLGQVPRAAFDGLRDLVGVPVLAVAGVGALAAVCLGRRATAAALGLLALALGEFAVLGLADVPLLERFLLVAAALTCFFFAYAVTAGRDQLLARVGPDRPWLRRASAALAAALVLLVAAQHVSGDVHVRGRQRAAVRAEADLAALASQARVRAAVRACPDFYVPRFTLTSLAAYDFGLSPAAIRRAGSRRPRSGLILAPVTPAAGTYFGITPARLRALRRIVPRSPPVDQNRSWRLYAAGCGLA